MSLTAAQRKQLHQTLTQSFNEEEMRQMLSLEMGEKLNNVSKSGTWPDRALEIIEWSERTKRTAELMAAAHNYRRRDDEKRPAVQSAPAPKAQQTADANPPAQGDGAQGTSAPQNQAAAAPIPPIPVTQKSDPAHAAPARQTPPPQPPKKRTIPPWVGVVAVTVLAGVILLFIEYGWFANDGGSPSTPEPANTVSATATLTAAPPSPTPPAPSAGVPTLEIAYGDSKQATVGGIDVLVSVPADPNPYLWMGAPESIEAVVVADGAQAAGRLKIGECLLAGGVTVTLLDTAGGGITVNRFAVSRAGEGGGAGCVNSAN